MRREIISKYVGEHVAIGVPHYKRNAPYFFYGILFEVCENFLILELEHKAGFKSIQTEEVVDIHLDRRYNGGKQ